MKLASNLNKDNLHSALVLQGYDNHVLQHNANHKPLFVGDLTFESVAQGITMHCCDGEEKQAASSTVAIDAGVSVNILFRGTLCFSLGKNTYQLMAKTQKPLLFINTISGKEMFTRHLNENQKVKKINVSINKQWLYSRCKTAADRIKIDSIFAHPSRVFTFDCVEELTNIANQLFTLKSSLMFEDQLKAEQLSIQLIYKSLILLLTKPSQAKSVPITNLHRQSLKAHHKCKIDKAFEDFALTHGCLSQIADYLGVSVSTLQRQVKNKYQVTAIEYLRNKRLDKAKSWLVLDGKSIGEVSFLLGYSHVSTFTTAFKKRFGVTPNNFRKAHS
ncbi:helix-turn-helix domain-containing protein [Pseudoalteromonas sp. C12FD-1]|jgi:AraC-like DNA-binding protein|uniref:helix-turn-helix domain-containing protein n=1 Tax=Pseudoalteromonas sp. C12FD-1 TaxID=3131979 RepID=UPI00307F4171